MKKLAQFLTVLLLVHTAYSVIVTGTDNPVFTYNGHKDTLNGHIIYATDPSHPFAKTPVFVWHPNKSISGSFTYRGTIGQTTKQDDQLIAQGLWVYVSGYNVTLHTKTIGALIVGTNKEKIINTLFLWEQKRRTNSKL